MERGDVHEVLPGLWLGSQAAAAQLEVLQSRSISRVVCLGSKAYHKDSSAISYVEFPQLLDVPTANLLQVLGPACAAIHEALAQAHGVLVHCVFGQSRGAAVCAAYLIQSRGSTVEEAVTKLTCARPAVQINAGFIAQLQLWHSIHNSSDSREAPTAGATVRWFLYAAGSSNTSIEAAAPTAAPVPQQHKYVCRKCRHPLFTSSNVIDHSHAVVQLLSAASNAATGYTAAAQSSTASQQHRQPCTSIFIEPVAWCTPVCAAYGTEKLLCPGSCGSKLGAYDAVHGLACSCGARVKPAIQMLTSKVEYR